MDFTVIETTVQAQVAAVTGLSADRDVFWQGRRNSTAFKATHGIAVELSWRQIEGTGTDEHRAAYAAGTRTLNVCGPRRALLQIRVEAQRQSPGAHAQHYAELVRTRWRRRSVIAALQAAGIGLGSIAPAFARDFTSDGRQLSVAVLEIPLHLAQNDLDTSTGAADWIESVRVTNDGGEVEIDTGEVPTP